jgi:hypothetical protein
MAIPRDLSAAGRDLFAKLADVKVTSLEAGATPREVLNAELYNLARTIVAYYDDAAQQEALLTFVLETLPSLVHQRQQLDRWRLSFGDGEESS